MALNLVPLEVVRETRSSLCTLVLQRGPPHDE
jgi:hypothetical protein